MPSAKASPPTTEIRSLNWLAIPVAAFALLHFVAASKPGISTWGINYWSELPLWLRCAFLLLVATVVLPGIPERIAALFERKAWPRWSNWVLALAALAMFMLLRSRGWSYGDGYSFRSYLEGGNLPSLGDQLALMAGDLVAHWAVFRAAVMPLGGSVELAYAIVSAVAGVASVAAIVRIGHALYPKNREARWTLVAGGFASGMAVLWFGHVEAYSLVSAALLWSLALLVERKPNLAWVLWVLACLFHLLAIAFLPVLLWPILGRRLAGELSRGRAVLLLAAGFFGWGIAGWVFSQFKTGIFVPLLPNLDSSYSTFSLPHLVDAANLLVFAAPLGILGLVTWLSRRGSEKSGTFDSPAPLFAVAAASLWYFSFWVDPLIGAFRDWDLIGLYGIPFSLLGSMILINRAKGTARAQWVVVAVLAVIHTLAFVLTIQDEARAMQRVDRFVRQDVHYSQEFHKGQRLMSWSYVLTHLMERQDLAVDHLRNRSQWEPRDSQSWMNLGSVYWHLKQYDSAASAFERSLAVDSSNARVLEMLTFAYSAAQRWPEAGDAASRLSRTRDLRTVEWNIWAFSLLQLNDNDRADSILSISLTRDPDQREGYYYRGIIAERRGDTAFALENYERAMAPAAEVDDVYLRATKLYQAGLRWADAERVCAAWQANYPNSANAHFFLGMSRIATQQYQGARDALERAAALDARSSLTQFYLATAYRNLGEREKAAAAARRAAEIDPNLSLPYLELVYLAVDAGDRAGAVAATREFLKRSPADSGMPYLQQFLEP